MQGLSESNIIEGARAKSDNGIAKFWVDNGVIIGSGDLTKIDGYG